MKKGSEEEMKNAIKTTVNAVDFPEDTKNNILAHIHKNVKKRRTIMRLPKKQTGIIIAAALIALGAVSALGAGKIAYLLSSHSIKDEIHNIAELKTQAQTALGESVRLPEQFSDGTTFSSGIVMNVNAHDERGNKVDSFPEMCAYYSNNLNLSILKPIDGINKSQKTPLISENYQEISLIGYIDNYLFLPPDAEPSEEDRKLEAEGKLMISYGSSEVERKMYSTIIWDEGNLHYMLSTFEDIALEDMMEMAKEIIDSEK